MRVLVTGASGAIGTPLVTRLVNAGHEVVGTHVSSRSAGLLRDLGAEPVQLDVLDREAVRRTVLDSGADALVHQATALAGAKFTRRLDAAFATTNRIRTEGTDNLLAAAQEAGIRNVVAQSFASYRYAREGGMVKTEDDPVDPHPLAGTGETTDAMRHLDDAVTAAGGIALRYGLFYGAPNDGLVEPVRKRQYPIVGAGTGMSSFVHVNDAAAATVLALGHRGPAVFNVVDDEPAPMREWLPVLAEALGAPAPRHVPPWLARLFAGSGAVTMALEARGASNARAKAELGWAPAFASWRTGFTAVYGP